MNGKKITIKYSTAIGGDPRIADILVSKITDMK
jgi:hypothetical protein